VERIVTLQSQARERYRELGINNIALKHSDGSWGWPQQAPYGAIMVTAAPEQVPEALLEQLAPGGIMVIPVGSQSGSQKLLLITREQDAYVQEELDPVRFVPLLNGAIR